MIIETYRDIDYIDLDKINPEICKIFLEENRGITLPVIPNVKIAVYPQDYESWVTAKLTNKKFVNPD